MAGTSNPLIRLSSSSSSSSSTHPSTQTSDPEEAQWTQLIKNWEKNTKDSILIRDLVRKGIPPNLRTIAWQLLSSNACEKINGKEIRSKFQEYCGSSSSCEKIIKRDITRTFPEIDYFKDERGPGQGALFNVMKAYSIHDPEVGYCQGSAFLVGVLLLNMPEEDAFLVLVRMMEDYRLREIYKPTMAELGLCMYQLESLVQELLPELSRHFESQNFHTSMYASSWFLTLFTSSLPLSLASRVIDTFLSEGMEMMFRISIAILVICKEELLKLDMEGLLKYFQKEMPLRVNIDPDFLMRQALAVKYDHKKLKK